MTPAEIEEAVKLAESVGLWAEPDAERLAKAVLALKARLELAENVCGLVDNQNHSRPEIKTPKLGKPKRGTGECVCAVCGALEEWRASK